MSPGTFYEYHVIAYNVSGHNDFTGTNATTPPAAPTARRPPPPSPASQINLSWAAPANNQVTRVQHLPCYRPRRRESTTPINAAPRHRHQLQRHTGLPGNTAYYYTIVALNAGGVGAASTETSATTQLSSPVIIDDASPQATVVGTWAPSTYSPGFVGAPPTSPTATPPRVDPNQITYSPRPAPGSYNIQLNSIHGGTNRATNVPVDVYAAGGSSHHRHHQRAEHRLHHAGNPSALTPTPRSSSARMAPNGYVSRRRRRVHAGHGERPCRDRQQQPRKLRSSALDAQHLHARIRRLQLPHRRQRRQGNQDRHLHPQPARGHVPDPAQLHRRDQPRHQRAGGHLRPPAAR